VSAKDPADAGAPRPLPPVTARHGREPPFEPRERPVQRFPLGWALKRGLSAWAADGAVLLLAVAAIGLPWAAAARTLTFRTHDAWMSTAETPAADRVRLLLLVLAIPFAHGFLAALAASTTLRRIDARVSWAVVFDRAAGSTLPCVLSLCAEYWIALFYFAMALSNVAGMGMDGSTAIWITFGSLLVSEAALVRAAPLVAEGVGFRRGRARVQALWRGLPRRRGGLGALAALTLVGFAVAGFGLRKGGFDDPVRCLQTFTIVAFALTTLNAAIGAAAYVHRRGVVDGAPAGVLAAVFE
jgi:hypothetical protein